MGVIAAKFNSHSRSDWVVLSLLFATWSFFFLLQQEPTIEIGASAKLSFALGAGLISYLTLKYLGYFDPLRLLPRKSDLLLALIAIPAGGLFEHALFEFVFDVPAASFRRILIYTPLLTAAVFGAHYIVSWLLIIKGAKKKVVLDLLPSERAMVLQAFEALDMHEHVQFLTFDDLRRHLVNGRMKEIALIVFSQETAGEFQAEAVHIRAHLAGTPIFDYRQVVADLQGRIPLGQSDLWTYIREATPQTQLLRTLYLLKMALEPPIAFALALVLSPLMLLIAAAIKLTSPGPVLYRQARVGHLGKIFVLLKFRSMYDNAEKEGPQWAVENDRRLTSIGRVIRRTRLDELPQLWNVIKGEMGFFGPRPERPEIYEKLKKEIPLFPMRLIVRPGITGWAQVCAGYAGSVEESRLKLEYDLFYIQHMSPRLDMIILAKTLGALVGLCSSEQRSEENISQAANW